MILDRLFPPEQKTVDATALTWAALGLPTSKTGLRIDIATALKVSVGYACCKVLTEDVGGLPLKLMQEKADGSKTVARTHPVHQVLFRRPNEWQTSMEWRMTMLLHALLSHGGYSYINRVGPNREVAELIPLLPQNVLPKQDRRTRAVTYQVSDGSGVVAILPREDVHVLRGLSWNGYSALPVVDQAREALGLALAAEESQARLHGNGARPGGVLSTDQVLTEDQINRMRASFDAGHAGVENAFKTLLLDGGLKFQSWAMTGVDAQQIQTRQHQVEEVCRYFRVFPSMVGYSDKTSTYASAEAFFSAHVAHSLMPWINRWEQAIIRDLLTPEDVAAGLFPKFYVNGLLRGDAKSRAEFYKAGITDGWMSRQEARAFEDMNPAPGLDAFLKPLNMGDGNASPTPDDDE
jgi:HK97 family phage portal protein